jgi:hypothetical protein
MATQERIYHSTIENVSVYVMRAPSNCERIVFAGNALVTSDPAVIEHLDEIADKPGSTIYTTDPRKVQDPAAAAAHTQVLANAATAHDKVVKSGEASKV